MAERAVAVRLPGGRSYDVCLASGWGGAGARLAALSLAGPVLLVSDTTVAPLYAKPVERLLRAAGARPRRLVLPSGERWKTLKVVERIYRAALEHGLDRGGALVALGGGVIGDMTGFAAATYLRGVDFVQFPTTLLAMVDASVGGKTGVNLPEGKNLVGAFHQPRLVYAALETLSTLASRQVRAGLAEVIKSGMIADARLVRHLERHVEQVLALDPEPLAVAVEAAVRVKARIVRADERERGQRALLNYGHTVGHALEAATSYRRFLHGEAVALGMIAAAALGQAMGITPARAAHRQGELIRRAGLPLEANVAVAPVLDALRYDKKIKGGVLRVVLTSKVGSASLHASPRAAVLKRAIATISSS